MKKIFLIIILCAIGIAIATCGGRTENEANYEDSVNIALENRDFVKAYRYLSYLDTGIGSNTKISKRDVVKKEALYVLDSQNEDGLARITLIINEHNATWLYNDLLQMAIVKNDEPLAIKIYKMGKSHVTFFSYDNNLGDLIVSADMYDLLCECINDNIYRIDDGNIESYLKKKGTYTEWYSIYEKQIINDVETGKIHESALAPIAFKSNNKKLTNIFVASLSKSGVGLPKFSEGKRNLGYSNGYDSFCSEVESIETYNKEVMEYLADAIKYKNKYAATKIVSLIKEEYTYQMWDNPSDDYFWCIISKNNDRKKEASNILQTAIRNGSFK